MPTRQPRRVATASTGRGAGPNVSGPERMVSTLAGCALVLSATGGGRLARTTRLLAGGVLVYRGVSGRCPAYTALQRNLAKHADGQGMVHFTRSITIAAPPHALYDAWMNPRILARMSEPIGAIQMSGNRWPWRLRSPVGGGGLKWQSDITEQRPGEYVGWTSSADGPLVHAGSIEFGPERPPWGTEVRLTMRFDGERHPVAATLLSRFSALPQAAAASLLQRFKSLVETGEAPTNRLRPAASNAGRSWGNRYACTGLERCQ